MSPAASPVRVRDSSITGWASTEASVSLRVPLRAVPMAVRQAETITASGMVAPLRPRTSGQPIPTIGPGVPSCARGVGGSGVLGLWGWARYWVLGVGVGTALLGLHSTSGALPRAQLCSNRDQLGRMTDREDRHRHRAVHR